MSVLYCKRGKNGFFSNFTVNKSNLIVCGVKEEEIAKVFIRQAESGEHTTDYAELNLLTGDIQAFYEQGRKIKTDRYSEKGKAILVRAVVSEMAMVV